MVTLDRIIDWLAERMCWLFGHSEVAGRTWCVYCGKDLS